MVANEQRTPQQEFVVILWFVAFVMGAAALVSYLFEEMTIADHTTAVVLRTVALAAVVAIPIGVLYAWGGWNVRDILGRNPNSIMIVASGLAGLVIWLIAWWLMFIMIDEIFVGKSYLSDIYQLFFYRRVWTGLVISDVVMWPLLCLLLVWGVLRWRMQTLPAWQFGFVAALLFGLMGMAVFGRDVASLVGYGMAGYLAGYLSAATRMAWTGFAVQGVFLYANMWLYDDLIIATAGTSFFNDAWLTRVTVSFFGLVLSVQVVRVLRDPAATTTTTKPMLFSQAAWPPLVILALVATVVAVYHWPL